MPAALRRRLKPPQTRRRMFLPAQRQAQRPPRHQALRPTQHLHNRQRRAQRLLLRPPRHRNRKRNRKLHRLHCLPIRRRNHRRKHPRMTRNPPRPRPVRHPSIPERATARTIRFGQPALRHKFAKWRILKSSHATRIARHRAHHEGPKNKQTKHGRTTTRKIRNTQRQARTKPDKHDTTLQKTDISSAYEANDAANSDATNTVTNIASRNICVPRARGLLHQHRVHAVPRKRLDSQPGRRRRNPCK